MKSVNLQANSANADGMAQLENTTAVNSTQTNNSVWDGMPLTTRPLRQIAPRQGEERIVPDYEDLTKRLYSLIAPQGGGSADYINYGPDSAPLSLFPVRTVFGNTPAFQRNMALFAGFSYDKIIVTCSLSSPKGIVGGLHVGYYPWTPWFQTNDPGVEAARHNLNNMTRQRLYLSPECHLMTYSSGQDVKFEIPWTFPTAFLPITFAQDGVNSLLIPGEPVVYVAELTSSYVSTVSLPAKFRVYVQFEGLKYYGPYLTDIPDAQSGLEIAAATAAGIVAEKTIETGVKFVNSLIGSTPDEVEDMGSESDSSFTRPIAVQQAYIGDSTSVGPPPTTPIFHNWLERGAVHPISDFLKRPQLLQTFNTSTDTTNWFYANPVFPTGWIDGPDQQCTYFRWFSNAAQFWRGTINFHFIVMGHPLVEVEHNLVIAYPDVIADGLPSFSVGDFSVMKGVTNGVAHITVPMPFLGLSDHLPIMDDLTQDLRDWYPGINASSVNVQFKVISTMLDVSPTIPIAVYMSAGDDFEFYQPYAIGMNNVQTVGSDVLAIARPDSVVAQVSLPGITANFETRAMTCPPTSTLTPMTTIESFMTLWSRCLPYRVYDSHAEPYPEAQWAGSPVSWPPTQGSAAWTLNVNNSWFNVCDYVAFFSSQFLLFRGSLGCKFIASAESVSDFDYMYAGLQPMLQAYRQQVNNPYTSDPATSLPVDANFGNGLIVTPTAKQPVIDLTLPYRSSLLWTTVCDQWLENPYLYASSPPEGSCSNIVYTNFVLQNSEADLRDILYRKAGPDYRVAVEGLLPPAPLWCAKGFDWSG